MDFLVRIIGNNIQIKEISMPRFSAKYAFVSLFVCLFTLSSYGWDDVGHKITGYIAWQRMSPEARENVIRILRKAPEDSHLAAYYMQYGPQTDEDRKRQYFVMVPTWADIVRDQSMPIRAKNYHRSNWHYSDTFWRSNNGKVEIITDKQPGGQGVNKLNDFDKVLRDPSVSDAEKAIAIAWFLHIGGDLHQPLHTSGRHTDLEKNGDQGGNLFHLTPQGTPRAEQVNLHWFWDSIAVRNMPILAGQCEDDYIAFVAGSILNRFPFPTDGKGLNLGRYSDWQQESFRIATTEVFRSDLKRWELPSDDYRRNAYNVSEQRLAMAGYRLGETLEQIFGKR